MAIIKNSISICNVVSASDVVQRYFDKSLTNIIADDLQGATNIKGYAFPYFSNLVEIVVPNTVTEIGQYAFIGCSSLTRIVMLSTQPPTISLEIFSGLSSNYSIYVPDSSVNTYKTASVWSDFASRIYGMSDYYHSLYPDFTWNGTTITGYTGSIPVYTTKTIQIPAIATEIGYQAFYNVGETDRTMYIIEFENDSKLTVIDYYGFGSGLVGINLPEGLLSIGEDAFIGSSFNSIIIPSSVMTIGDYAFEFNQQLETVTVLATTPPTLGSDAFFDTPIEWSANGAIYVPAESVNAYKSATNWSTYSSKIQAIPNN